MSRTPRHRAAAGSAARPLDQEAYDLELEAPEGSARLSVLATMPAVELHRWLAERLGYSPEVPYTLEVAPSDDPSGEESLEPHADPAASDPRTLLGGLGLIDGSRLYYDLDGDGWGCNLLVHAVGDRRADVDYPLVSAWSMPDQIDPTNGDSDDGEGEPLDDDLHELEGLLAEALEAFDPTSLDDEAEATIPAATLAAQLPLARRLLESTRDRQDQAFVLSERVGVELDDWIWSLVDELEEGGREADALDLLDEASKSRQLFPEVRSRRALLLVALQRPDEARALIDELLTEGNHPDQRFLAGQALDPLIELGDLRRAESLAYELRRVPDLYARYDAVDALVKIYQRTNRRPQARKLEREAQRLAGEIERAEERAMHAEDEEGDA